MTFHFSNFLLIYLRLSRVFLNSAHMQISKIDFRLVILLLQFYAPPGVLNVCLVFLFRSVLPEVKVYELWLIPPVPSGISCATTCAVPDLRRLITSDSQYSLFQMCLFKWILVWKTIRLPVHPPARLPALRTNRCVNSILVVYAM